VARFAQLTFTTSTGIVTFTAAPRGLQISVESTSVFTPPGSTTRLILEAPQRAKLRQWLAEQYPGDRGWL